MKLEFKKNRNKKHVIVYHRDNGTETWMYADDFFIAHDLSHYAIEKTLGYKTAFYGMINSGIELSDFLDKRKRDVMSFTNEAMNAESMANLFLMDKNQGRVADFNRLQQDVLHTTVPEVSPLQLTEVQIDSIRNRLVQLLSQWNQLKANQSLHLEIDV